MVGAARQVYDTRVFSRIYAALATGIVARQRGAGVGAPEIAARTVNKERARTGEAREASPASVSDISSGRRGGLRSHSGPGGRTRAQLYEEAKDLGIKGRSKMNKRELVGAVEGKKSRRRR